MTNADIESRASIVTADRSCWAIFRFDQIATSVTNRVDDPAEAGVDYYVGLEHLDSESLKIRRWGAPTDVEATKLRFQPGDIIFGRRRAYQRKVAVAEFEGICSAHALVLRPRTENIVPEFLPFFMQSDVFFDRALAISVGSLSPTINWKTLAQQEFLIPPKDEQHRIAEILWAVDSSVEDWTRTAERHVQLRDRLLRDLFTSEEWPRELLGNHVLSSAYGPRFSNGLYTTQQGIGCIRTTDLTSDGEIVYSTVPLARLDLTEMVGHILLEGDFLISRSGTCGIGAVFTEQSRPMIPGAFLIRLRMKESMSPIFLREYINSPIGRAQMDALAQGGVQKNIRGSSLLNELVPVPSHEIQERTLMMLSTVEGPLRQTKRHITELRDLKSILISTLLCSESAIRDYPDVH